MTSSLGKQDMEFCVTSNPIANSIHVTRSDVGKEALILNKVEYYSKVNAILSDTFKLSRFHNDTYQHS